MSYFIEKKFGGDLCVVLSPTDFRKRIKPGMVVYALEILPATKGKPKDPWFKNTNIRGHLIYKVYFYGFRSNGGWKTKRFAEFRKYHYVFCIGLEKVIEVRNWYENKMLMREYRLQGELKI